MKVTHDVDRASKVEWQPAVIILHEVNMHPNSLLLKLEKGFERPSIVHIVSKEGLKSYSTPPIYDPYYLVLFDSVKMFEGNLASLHLEYMLPVISCTSKKVVEDAKTICQDHDIPFRLCENKFTKEDAYNFVRTLASVSVSQTFVETLVRRVGLSPQRIVSAVMICEQVGFTTANISKYVDKHIYIDSLDVIESLLGVCTSQAQRRRAATYLEMNRVWYAKYTKSVLLKEVATLITLFNALVDGSLTAFTVRDYGEQNKIPHHKVMYAIELFGKVSLYDLIYLQRYITMASLLELVLQLQ